MITATLTAAAPRFEVVRLVGQYDCYDRIVGWTARRIAVAQTAGWAHAIAAREDHDYDITAEVRDLTTGRRVYRQWPAVSFDDCPF